MSSSRYSVPLAVTALLVVAAPTEALAQACAGNTAAPGQGFAAGQVAFTDGAWAFGANGGGNTVNSVTIQGDILHTLYDNSDLAATSISGSVAFELPASNVSACPVGTVGYQWLSNTGGFGDQLSADGFVLAAGMALGADFQTEAGLRVVPRGSIAVVHNRASATVGGLSGTSSETYGSFGAALMLGSGSAYGGPEVSISTLEGSNPVFSVRAGVVF